MNHRVKNAFRNAAVALSCACAAGPALAADTRGYLYGSILTKSGATYEGRLRWGKEEAFWTDHFNASKAKRPLADEIPRKYRNTGEPITILGLPIGMKWSSDESRQLIVRFGDLTSIEVEHHDEATLTLKSGEKVEIDGGSNDLGGTINVWDRSLGEVAVKWSKIRRIDFKPTPPDLADVPARLHGTVKTRTGTLTGFVQWDKEECLATDKLDGETDDGKLSVEMGKVKAIERRGRDASTVTLKDGRRLELSGTNDVDSDNRGIWVDDARYGRVLVSWKAFDRLDVDEAGSGPAYEDFHALGPLHGVVKTRDGKSHKGRVVFDADEASGWEMLDGEDDDMTYSIPFFMVASITHAGSVSKVTVRGSDQELRLSDTADVSNRNAGVFILEGDRKTYVPWEDVNRIDFEK